MDAGLARERIAAARAKLDPCTLCPRDCRVDRPAGETGRCGVGTALKLSSVFPHFGEERPLVGAGGSGTVFLAGCNLRCLFCQNSAISHVAPDGAAAGPGVPPPDVARLARRLLGLEAQGCLNVNFVTPTHYTPQLMEAIFLARQAGLAVPVVYNCGGYESLETLRLLEGFVEIYMPDAKWTRAETAAAFADAPDYPAVMRAALKEMHRQVGDLVIEGGRAVRGLLVRHLVLPGGAEEGRAVVDFLADGISPRTYLNVMGQYRPCYRAAGDRLIGRYPRPDEIRSVRAYADERGLRLD